MNKREYLKRILYTRDEVDDWLAVQLTGAACRDTRARMSCQRISSSLAQYWQKNVRWPQTVVEEQIDRRLPVERRLGGSVR